ncbi:MAG: type IX secretion system membrane protein PorP/SprF, partial [Sphingobacteriaceae bacterium]
LTANYQFQLNDYIKLKPSMLLKYTAGVPLEFDINANACFEDKGLWLGLGYRSNAAVMAMFQVKVTDRIQLGYSHDFMTSMNVRHQMGTHEVMLNYRFKGKRQAGEATDK